MGLFSFFKKKQFFSANEQEELITAIRIAEQQTSGEIRLFVEAKNQVLR